jgi:hypothetical protein
LEGGGELSMKVVASILGLLPSRELLSLARGGSAETRLKFVDTVEEERRFNNHELSAALWGIPFPFPFPLLPGVGVGDKRSDLWKVTALGEGSIWGGGRSEEVRGRRGPGGL